MVRLLKPATAISAFPDARRRQRKPPLRGGSAHARCCGAIIGGERALRGAFRHGIVGKVSVVRCLAERMAGVSRTERLAQDSLCLVGIPPSHQWAA